MKKKSELSLKGLSIENISMRFDLKNGSSVQALKDVSLEIEEGQIITVLGPSGCGKTTLLNIIAGFLAPTEGKVILNENTVQGPGAERGMVFQQGALFEWMNVRENVAFGPRMKGMPKSEQNEKVKHLLDVVGLAEFEDKAVYELSGGMQQRVGLARALSTDADILLMDEAFSALDPLIRTDMQDVLLDLQKELHKTVIFITHDLDEALRIGDNIAILRDGEVVQQGNPQEIILNPADEYVSDFIQDINRPRVLQIGSIADPKTKSKGPSMDAETVVEDALQEVIAAKADGVKVTRDGKSIGSASLEQMIHAIARPTGDKKGIESYR